MAAVEEFDDVRGGRAVDNGRGDYLVHGLVVLWVGGIMH